MPDEAQISEQVSYHLNERNIRDGGEITISFVGIQNVHAFLAKISAVCDETRKSGTKTIPAIITQVSEKPTIATKAKSKTEKPHGPVPKVKNGRPSAWEYKAIKESTDLDELVQDYHRKFPHTVISNDELKELWIYYHPKASSKRESESPAPRTEADPEPGKQIGVGSKVIQVNGNAPAPGIGTVTEIKKDGSCKVQFFNHVKVLPINHFALATLDDVNRAKNGAS